MRTPLNGAPVSTATRSTAATKQNWVTRSMKETLKHFDKIPATEVLLDVVIVPGLTTGLNSSSETWQQMRYDSLMFKVAPNNATSVAGSWMAAFVVDPTDEFPSSASKEQRLSWMRSHKYTASGKWWEAKTFRVPGSVWLYTNAGNDLRLSSPGRLVVISVDAPTGDTPCTIDLDWTCSFRQEALQSAGKSTTTDYVTTANFEIDTNGNVLSGEVAPVPPDGTVLRLLKSFMYPQCSDTYTVTGFDHIDAIKFNGGGVIKAGHITVGGDFVNSEVQTLKSTFVGAFKGDVLITHFVPTSDFQSARPRSSTWVTPLLQSSENGTFKTLLNGRWL